MADSVAEGIDLGQVRAEMRSAAERLSLPLKTGLRRTSGNVPGSAAGSSIDFQDHRPYVPGDDPRHIDWQAYARSGHYSMKLYREEVRPIADVVLDASPSMFFDPGKAERSWELAFFCLESVLRSGAAVRLYSLQGAQLTLHEARAGWQLPAAETSGGSGAPPDWSRVPWRAGSLRVVISDLLFPAVPEAVLGTLLQARGRVVVLAPWCTAEAEPDWLGNLELEDCETAGRRDLRFGQEDLRRYGEMYRKHFALWLEAAQRRGVALARVGAEGSFLDALSREGLPRGAVEMV